MKRAGSPLESCSRSYKVGGDEIFDLSSSASHPFYRVVTNTSLLISIGLCASSSPSELLNILPRTCKTAQRAIVGLMEEFESVEAATNSISKVDSAAVQLVHMWWMPLGIGRFPMRLSKTTASSSSDTDLNQALPCRNAREVIDRMKTVLSRRLESLDQIYCDQKKSKDLVWEFQRSTMKKKKKTRKQKVMEIIHGVPNPREVPQYVEEAKVRSFYHIEDAILLYDAQHLALSDSFSVPITDHSSRDKWKVCSLLHWHEPLELPIETHNLRSSFGDNFGNPYPLIIENGDGTSNAGIRRTYDWPRNEVTNISRAFVPKEKFEEGIQKIDYIDWKEETNDWTINRMRMFDPDNAWENHVQILFQRLVCLDSITFYVVLSPPKLRGEIWYQEKSKEPRKRRKEDAKALVYLAPDAASWVLAKKGSEQPYECIMSCN